MQKPKDSKILLCQTDDNLEVIIPPLGFRGYLSVVIIVMELILSFPLMLIAYGIYAADFPYKIVCSLFSLPFLGVAIALGTILLPLFCESTHLCINPRQISLTHKMFGSETYSFPVIQREDVNELERTEGYIKKPETKYSNSIMIAPKIILWAGEQKLNLEHYSSHPSSELEIDWLAYELSNWLKLPITRK